jgi:hypothetical protein
MVQCLQDVVEELLRAIMPERGDIGKLKRVLQLGIRPVPDQTPKGMLSRKLRMAAPAIRQAQDTLLCKLYRFR